MSRQFSAARIGFDLDNTLISYDRLFHQAALERELIPTEFAGSKREIRDHIRRSALGDLGWQRLQAHVYGPAISGAIAAEGALDFIRLARSKGARLSIVSHKTASANIGNEIVDLREAARQWLLGSGMVGPDAVPPDMVFFESTRQEKIQRIVELGCTHFIDDLEEVFEDPSFPTNVERFLFVPSHASQEGPFTIIRTFREFADAFHP